MSTLTLEPPKTVRMVPIQMLASLARLALKTLCTQQQYYKSRLREHLKQSKALEAELSKSATAALELWNTTPELFGETEKARPEVPPVELTAAQVIAWLEQHAEALTMDDPNNPREAHDLAVAALDAEVVREAIEIITKDNKDIPW